MGVVLLARHGQASFGAADYDVLSDLGQEQARILGRRLGDAGGVDRIVHGALVRQADTAELAAACLADPPPLQRDARWDEYDHTELVAAALHAPEARTALEGAVAESDDARRAFQVEFERALDRWTGGAHDDDYEESYAAFRRRVDAALRDLVDDLGRAETVLVVTSGGVISAICAAHLGLDAGSWARVNRVLVNGSLTKLVAGRGGVNLLTINDHAHLEAAGRDAITYR